MNIINYGKHNILQEDIDAVVEVLKSNNLTQGPKILEFELAFANYVGSKYAVAVSNGTAALHLSALSLGVKSGDCVLTTPITFSASANCIRYCDGAIEFLDIDPKTYLIDLEKLKEKINSKPLGYYKAIIPVDFAGRPNDLEKIKNIADKFGIKIISDCCHSPGGHFIDSSGEINRCGNGAYADLSIFSFHPVKHIATGEGGMITTNNKILYEKIRNLRTHGIQQDPEKKIYNHGVWYYEMQELGYNYRLTDIQSALGISQLKRLDNNISSRKKIAKKYFDAFKDKPFVISQSGCIEGHAYHLYVFEVLRRNELITFLHSNNILAQVHYIPVHLMPYYRNLGWNDGDLPFAEAYYKNCLSLPMYPTLKEEEQDFVIEQVLKFYTT